MISALGRRQCRPSRVTPQQINTLRAVFLLRDAVANTHQALAATALPEMETWDGVARRGDDSGDWLLFAEELWQNGHATISSFCAARSSVRFSFGSASN